MFARACLTALTCSLLLLSSCSKGAEVRAVAVSSGSVEATVSSITSGTVRAEQVTDLAFGGVGRVAKLNVRLGARVKATEILAELENSDLRTAVEVSEREFVRQSELYKSKVASQSEMDRARERRDAMLVALEKSLIRAPYDGTVTEMNLEVGQLSQITAVIPKPLIRLVDDRLRYVRAEIDEVDLSRVKVGMPASIKILAVRKQPFPGKVRKIVSAINSVREQDRTAAIELSIDTSDILPEGASADVEIVVERADQAVLVPSRAVLGRKGKSFVFVEDGGLARRRELTLGIRGFEQTQVLSGVKPGERVLIPSDLSELEDGKRVRLKEVS